MIGTIILILNAWGTRVQRGDTACLKSSVVEPGYQLVGVPFSLVL